MPRRDDRRPQPVEAVRGASASLDRPSAVMPPRSVGIRLRSAGQVGRARLGVELVEQRVVARLASSAAVTAASGSLMLPKMSASAGQACWQAVTISPSRIGRSSRFGADARVVDALHAVRALLHDAAAAHGDVGVEHHLEHVRLRILVEREVEAPHLVRAVVRAVPGADAAVVDHVVQAFVVVHGRVDRADDLARRLLAVHAEHRLVVRSAGLSRSPS